MSEFSSDLERLPDEAYAFGFHDDVKAVIEFEKRFK